MEILIIPLLIWCVGVALVSFFFCANDSYDNLYVRALENYGTITPGLKKWRRIFGWPYYLVRYFMGMGTTDN